MGNLNLDVKLNSWGKEQKLKQIETLLSLLTTHDGKCEINPDLKWVEMRITKV